MSCDKDVCFGCNGGFDGEDEIASRYKSTLAEFKFDLRIEKEDVEAIEAFYQRYGKSDDTFLCWTCALARVLEYTSKYDDLKPINLELSLENEPRYHINRLKSNHCHIVVMVPRSSSSTYINNQIQLLLSSMMSLFR